MGTPTLLTKKNGQVQWKGMMDAFGAVTETVNTISSPLRFPGQYFDAETGYHQNYFRDYDPVTGRYIESDQIGLLGGVNNYGYAFGNPVLNTDPLGLFVCGGLCVAAIGALVWGAVDAGMQLYDNGGNIDCINWWDVGVSAGLGALGGGLMGKAFRKVAGKEWSHWIPDRYIRKLTLSGKKENVYYKPWVDKYLRNFVNSRFNGNYVDKLTHALTDNFRNLKGMTRADKLNVVLQQILRIPGWIPGIPITAAAANSALSNSDPEYGCGT